MALATVTSKGQLVIPKPVREHLKIKPGDKVDFVIKESGEVVVRPMVDVRELAGILYRPGRKAVSLEEMDRAIAEGAAKGL